MKSWSHSVKKSAEDLQAGNCCKMKSSRFWIRESTERCTCCGEECAVIRAEVVKHYWCTNC